ncbi:hypothetical protein [Alsobacter soli]|uniref:hypothetical protein n=1 Tax=Alsobacter soli TaxID=2109933 RepID=UPI0011B288A7|nr:hypothetical protein [Alsobacter soli]
MALVLRYLFVLVVASAAIAALQAFLNRAFDGNVAFAFVAALFWVAIVGGALLLDRQKNRPSAPERLD